MIQLFVSDLDGTLLNEMHTVDAYILETLELIQSNGYLFSCATGRSLHEHEVNRLQLQSFYRICMNGSLIRNPKGEILYSKPINPAFVKAMLEEFSNLDFDYATEQYTLSMISREEKIERFKEEGFKDQAGSPLRIRDFFMDYRFNQSKEDILKQNIYKINCSIQNQELVLKYQDFISKYSNLIINAPAEQKHFEITSIEANKGNAISYLANLLKIKEDEVMVFGDGGNDLEMLSRFKNSYAMENGCAHAKNAARYLIGTNKEYAVCNKIRNTLSQ